jgi:hypothetical protein
MSKTKKGCPLLSESDTRTSFTIAGESSTRTYLLCCIEEKCAAYRRSGVQSGVCAKFGTDIWYEESESVRND